jgi:hypothetical protein
VTNRNRSRQVSYWRRAGNSRNRAWLSLGWAFPTTSFFRSTAEVRSARRASLSSMNGRARSRPLKKTSRRLVQGAPALNYHRSDIEQLRQEKTTLIELQRRARQIGCPGSTTVIEALFPDIAVKKKTASEKAEIEQWLAIRKEAALKIDPETAEVDWSWRQTLDPYGVKDEWEHPREFDQVGREYFARSPGSDVWVSFDDLPDAVIEKLRARRGSQIAVPAGLEGLPDPDLPF